MRKLLVQGVFFFPLYLFAQTTQGVKPGIIINGNGCKIKNQQFSCTPRTCDSLVIAQGDSVNFCTDSQVDLQSDTLFYMEWDFNGSDLPNPIINNAPYPVPVCYDPTWNIPGDYTVDVFYNGELSAYPDADCYQQGPSHWIVKINVLPLSGMEDELGDHFDLYLLSGTLHIQTDLQDKFNVDIFDLQGKVISRREASGQSNISLEGSAAGLYFCRVSLGEKVFYRKLLLPDGP